MLQKNISSVTTSNRYNINGFVTGIHMLLWDIVYSASPNAFSSKQSFRYEYCQGSEWGLMLSFILGITSSACLWTTYPAIKMAAGESALSLVKFISAMICLGENDENLETSVIRALSVTGEHLVRRCCLSVCFPRLVMDPRVAGGSDSSRLNAAGGIKKKH